MMKPVPEDKDNIRLKGRSGIVLIITIIVLVVLISILYSFGSMLNSWKSRQQYIIDYQKADYGAQSAMKYALSAMSGIDANYVERPNEPDFSDLFDMNDTVYKNFLDDWAVQLAESNDINNTPKTAGNGLASLFANLAALTKQDSNDANNSYDVNNVNDVNNFGFLSGNEPNSQPLYVRGPYGPQWPYVTKPTEFDFGDSHVRIEIIDENAKMPMDWGIYDDNDSDVQQAAQAAITAFFQWMQMEPNQIQPIIDQLDKIKKIKYYNAHLPKIYITRKVEVAERKKQPRRLTLRRRAVRRSSVRKRTVIKKIPRPDFENTTDFAKIMNSSLLDTENLAKPVNSDPERPESPLKYISLWGSQKVNINTAPRNVLEAAFTFGGDPVALTQEIINQRRIKPFKDIEDLKKRLYSYTDLIDRCADYICTQSTVFSIRATATSGLAKVCAIAGVKKDGDKIENIGLIME